MGLDLETRGIGLTYFNYADEDIVIIADPEQLMRVVNNIVTNAIKYMDKQKGQINVRIKDVGDFIQVEIEDNGKGISAVICRIFLTVFTGRILREILPPEAAVSVCLS